MIPSPPDPFKYKKLLNQEELFKDGQKFRDILSRLRCEYLVGVAANFYESIKNTHNLASLPQLTALYSTINIFGQMTGLIKSGAWKDTGISGLLDTEYLNKSKGESLEAVKELEDEGLLESLLDKWGADVVIRCSVIEERVSLVNVFKSIVIESWLYFEIFAGDLWVTLMDHGSSKISLRALKTNWGQSDLKIKARDLFDMSIDPRRSLGTFFRESGIVSFQKISDIRKNYQVIFNAPSMLGGDISLLNAYRNSLVHRAGKADGSFIRAVEPYPEFSHIKKGDLLPLDGEVVARLRKASLEAASELLDKGLAYQKNT